MSISFELSDGLQSEAGAVIKVISVGGGGGNAIENMITNKVENVEFICANTDVQALKKSNAPTILQLGEEITKGLGAGTDPVVGARAAEESRSHIAQAINGANILFIAVGMGGGTGTGAAPIVAQLAKEQGILTVAVVTRPFSFEGIRRGQVAKAGIDALSKYVDSLITIPNDKLLTVLGKSISLLDAFKAANAVLQGAVQGIADLITRPGLINVDFADVRTVMSEMGMAMMGTGSATGENRAREAAEAAISSPLLEDINLNGARGVLVNISGGHDMSIGEFEIVGDVIRSFTSEDAVVVVGTVIEPDMIDELRVTVVVTGLPDQNQAQIQQQGKQGKGEQQEEENEGDQGEGESGGTGGRGIIGTNSGASTKEGAIPTDIRRPPATSPMTAASNPKETSLTDSLNNDGTINYRKLERPTLIRQSMAEPPAMTTASPPNYNVRQQAPTPKIPTTPPPIMTPEYLDIPTFLRQQRKKNEEDNS